ncbi:MAG: hypothetical protein ABIG90_03700 [bacterium]
MKLKITHGLPIGCSKCVIPENYAGARFYSVDNNPTCNFCLNHQEREFLGEQQLIADLSLEDEEQVGVTVSGGKDSLYTWMWLVDNLGPEKVVAFNHNKIGFVHPLAQENLKRSEKILGSELMQFHDEKMLPRFRNNLAALLSRPDSAMVRVALCAGCRIGISGKMFELGKNKNISKFVSSASYLELAPFKAALMKAKSDGSEKEGLLIGLNENPLYNQGDSLEAIMIDDEHCHETQLSGKKGFRLYPEIRYFDFTDYIPNIPSKYEKIVKERLGWQRPERSWHFDCMIESFKDLFYYGILGYTETDFKLSSMIRYNLISREEAIKQLLEARRKIINSREGIFSLMQDLGVRGLISQVNDFYRNSSFLSEK